MTDPDLIRFLDAQDQIHQQVLKELAAGRKETHWMWFIFPQLAGLGRSGMAQRYAIRDLDQAKRYLADAILGPRLRQVVKLLIARVVKFAQCARFIGLECSDGPIEHCFRLVGRSQFLGSNRANPHEGRQSH